MVSKNMLCNLLHDLGVQLQDEIFPVIKIEIHRPRRDTRQIGNLFDGKTMESLMGQQVQRGLQNSFAFIHRELR